MQAYLKLCEKVFIVKNDFLETGKQMTDYVKSTQFNSTNLVNR